MHDMLRDAVIPRILCTMQLKMQYFLGILCTPHLEMLKFLGVLCTMQLEMLYFPSILCTMRLECCNSYEFVTVHLNML